jgi:hypothetical protein
MIIPGRSCVARILFAPDAHGVLRQAVHFGCNFDSSVWAVQGCRTKCAAHRNTIIDAAERAGQRTTGGPPLGSVGWEGCHNTRTKQGNPPGTNQALGGVQSPPSSNQRMEEKMAEPTYDELKARLEELEKKSVRRTGELDFKVGEKGGVSVYGLGRFPVTLYYEQWNRLLEAAPKLREFLEENKSRLKLKEK